VRTVRFSLVDISFLMFLNRRPVLDTGFGFSSLL
jgi:hypothetical protein